MIKIISIGKLKEKALESLQKEYLKRLSAFFRVEVIEVKDEPERKGQSEKDLIEKEAIRALEKIKPADTVVLLDLHGKMIDSLEFTKLRQKWVEKGDLTFVIAGSRGPGHSLKRRADYAWKLSDLTFPHQLCRILLLEQIYRSYMIENNRTYHK